ncbi:MAG: quinol:cytochrome C oxidoreductase, partial [bacterium]
MSHVNLGSSPVVAKINKLGLGLAAVGALGLAATYLTAGAERFFADYLIGFWYFAGISVTMMFFSALQYLARAGWSASVRRIAE